MNSSLNSVSRVGFVFAALLLHSASVYAIPTSTAATSSAAAIQLMLSTVPPIPTSTPAEGIDWGEEEGFEEEGFGDADDVGFSDLEVPTSSTPTAEPSPFSITGFARSAWGVWIERLEDHPWAKGRQSLDLELRYKSEYLRLIISGHGEYDLAYLYKSDRFDQPTRDRYRSLVDLREAYAATSFGPVELSFGWQTVAWGEGDVLSPIDVVNPRDLRDPGLADLDDLRLPILASRLGVFFGYHRFEAMVLHEADFGYRSPPFGPFSALPTFLAKNPDASQLDLDAILQGRPLSYRDEPGLHTSDSQQFLLRWVYRGPGIDLGLYAASVLDQIGTIAFPSALQVFLADEVNLILNHERYLMAGHSGAWPSGSFLFKWEIYVTSDRAFNVLAEEASFESVGTREAPTMGGMIGISYSGITDTTLALEVEQRKLLKEVDDLLLDSEQPTIALRSRHTFLREDLELNLALTINGWRGQLGWLARGEVSYVLRDGLRIGGGFITYQPSDEELSILSGFDRHDRAFLKARWDFTVL